MMQGFLAVFQSRNAEVHEEALMAISALALALGENFTRYMQNLAPPLYAALENMEDFQVCAAAVGLVGDLSRALGKSMSPFVEEIFVRLMKLLMNQHVDRSVKPPILSTFGDVALALGGEFHKYMDHSMTMLYNASQIQIENREGEELEYMHTLLENILEGYSGIVQALRDADRAEGGSRYVQEVVKYLPNIVFLLEKRIHPEVGAMQALPEDERDHRLLKASLGLLGDLAQALPQVKSQFTGQWVRDLLQVGSTSPDIDNEDVQFAARIIQ